MISNDTPARTSHRPNRVADLIRQEVASFIVNGVKDPRIGFVTITQVKMTADLHIARVYYSTYGSKAEQEETTTGLRESAGKIRTHLAKLVKMRTVPRLEFFIDEGLEHSYKIQSLLGELSREPKSEAEIEAVGESDLHIAVITAGNGETDVAADAASVTDPDLNSDLDTENN